MMSMENKTAFYHLYPLGLCGAPGQNDLLSEPVPRLEKVYSWLDHIQWLGMDAVILGPVFESLTHGYDTVDYRMVDRRLGTEETLERLVEEMHRRGISVVLDAVFNHVSRRFHAFEDVQRSLESSPYWNWFSGLRMEPGSITGDPFSYEGWHGHMELVKLDTANHEVREYLLSMAGIWMDRYGIDGFRLDAADCLDMGFLRKLANYCGARRKDFWLMGEVVFGDYNEWVVQGGLDSVTNYQVYKPLYSSLNDGNFYELDHALERAWGSEGLYAGLHLYNFVDNHDVDRIASKLLNPAHLPLVYGLLFTIPGIPSLYYGSEWGYPGKKLPRSDQELRPDLDLDTCIRGAPEPYLPGWIRKLAELRLGSEALRFGRCRILLQGHEQFAFSRESDGETIVAALNSSDQEADISFPWSAAGNGALVDVIGEAGSIPVRSGNVEMRLPPFSFHLLEWHREED